MEASSAPLAYSAHLLTRHATVRKPTLERGEANSLPHIREAILLYLQGHLTSEIARKIQHNPEDVDRYIYDYQRVVELAQKGRSVPQIGFLTNPREHLLRKHIALWKEFDA